MICICCNVLDTSEFIKDTFDIVFTGNGVIGWLPDLKPWGLSKEYGWNHGLGEVVSALTEAG
ncbi:hypothetical protein [Algibacter sp. 2305UL17-15]|uniref:hypothetical protein n=1 Tax=Algibacter sp. 2305UL17-15 TaxID=3231268 RepID=UPI00345AF410